MKNYPEKEVLLHYKGPLEFDTIGDLIHQLKDRVRDHHVKYVVYKKILMVMIESLENIIRYTEHFANNDFILSNYPPEFTISLSNNLFVIESSNAIRNQDIDELESKLGQLKKMDKKEIKELYRTTITNGQFSDKGGAGLGIIEMAKITDKRIEYSIQPIDETYSFFLLQLVVKRGNHEAKTDI